MSWRAIADRVLAEKADADAEANVDHEERAALIEEGAAVPRGWAEGLARLDRANPPAGVRRQDWLAAINCAGRFLDAWGARAQELGWTAEELFGANHEAPLARLDQRGVAFSPTLGTVVEITADEITLEHHGGRRQKFRRAHGRYGPPIWDRAS